MMPWLEIRDRLYFSFGAIGLPQTEPRIGDIGVNNGYIRPSNPISGSGWTIFPFFTSFDSSLLIGMLPFAIYTNITLKYIKSFVMYALMGMICHQRILKNAHDLLRSAYTVDEIVISESWLSPLFLRLLRTKSH